MNWTNADTAYNLAKANFLLFHWHVLVWATSNRSGSKTCPLKSSWKKSMSGSRPLRRAIPTSIS